MNQNHSHQAALESRMLRLTAGEALPGDELREHDFLWVTAGDIEVALLDGRSQTLSADATAQNRAAPPRVTLINFIEARTDATILLLASDELDFLVFWEHLQSSLIDPSDELRRRMDKVRHSLAFRRIPAEALSSAIERMQPMAVSAGQDIVTQGEPGNTFYLIDEGEAEVWQTGLYDDEPQRVATLKTGDAFGDEALIQDSMRSATVRMASDGSLLTLGKDDFQELISAPLVKEASATLAQAMIAEGHGLLDVRYEEEHDEAHLPGDILIPLHDLRARADELNPEQAYVVYCRSGRRSAIAAMLLNQRGFQATSLAGGIRDWPFETESAS